MQRFKDQNKKKAITLSYDDGVVQDIRLTEMLNQYGLKATFNINSELLGTPRIMERSAIIKFPRSTPGRSTPVTKWRCTRCVTTT